MEQFKKKSVDPKYTVDKQCHNTMARKFKPVTEIFSELIIQTNIYYQGCYTVF